jgi:hypothetical protein
MSDELFEAIDAHDVDRLQALLERGADPSAACPAEKSPYALTFTALQAAVRGLSDGGSIDGLLVLLRHGARVNDWDPEHDSTPLLTALYLGQPEAARLLLAAGADPNVRSSEGDTPLGLCAQCGDVTMARTLLRFGARRTVDEGCGTEQCTALGIAVLRLDLPMIALLVQAGADPRKGDETRAAIELVPSHASPDVRAAIEALFAARAARRTTPLN